MRGVVGWVKANPITIVSGVVLLASLGVLIWLQLQGAALRAEVQEKAQAVSRLTGLGRVEVAVPAANPDDPPQKLTVTPSRAEIDRLSSIYTRMIEEHQALLQYIEQRNKAGKTLFLEGILPEAEHPALPFEARVPYPNAFPVMLEPPTPEAEGPRLNAGQPPNNTEIAEELAEIQQTFLAAKQATSVNELDEQQQEELLEDKRLRLMELLFERAESIHVYAATDVTDPQFPFDVQNWWRLDTPPQPHQLWEGQLELWIQQDIAKTIELANNISRETPEGRMINESTSVLTAPVKRLISIDVLPGYVGLHTLGGVAGGQASVGQDGMYPPPAGGRTPGPQARQPDNFYVGPTGRVSNGLYDVRHVKLHMIADYQQLPRFFEALDEVNFMTVLECDVSNVDEYQSLRDGYVFGSADAVDVQMVIETLWLRSWTQPLMPRSVRQYVGIEKSDKQRAPTGREFSPFGGQGGSPFIPDQVRQYMQ